MRSMLVHMDGTPRCAVRLMLARQLAQRLDAKLTALFATTPPQVDMPYAYAASAVSVNLLQDLFTQRLARAKTTFDEARASRSGEVAWAELSAESPVQGVARQALFADLVVLGQHDPTQPLAQELPADFVESVLIESGSPGLVVPYAGHFRSVGDVALLAWKPSAECARAVRAALPLLRRARQVHVVTWGEDRGAHGNGEALDLERYLALHGVKPTWHRHHDEPRAVGEALLSLAADVDADLMVMGCYGHSRARELVLGGASRTLLRSMTVPVLMSH